MDMMRLAREEREDLLAFLTTLSPSQWNSPTLCKHWRVHDLVAHLISYDELDVGDLARRFAKGRFLPQRVNTVGVKEYNKRRPEELRALLRDHVQPRGLMAAFGGEIGLADALIHHQDIRRPLGIAREIPAERLRPTLYAALFSPVLRGILRVWDLRVVATDLDWSFGRGPEVQGSAEALLMCITGRRGVVSELSGPGQPKLATRIEA